MAIERVSRAHPGHDESIRASRRYHGVYHGVVRDNKDTLRMGRLKVWVDSLGGDFDDPASWITASYCSPFAGATDFEDVDIGDESRPENSQTSYGFWAVPPDINNSVLIMFINGDPSRAVWIGCLYQPKVNRMVPGIPHGVTFDTDDRRPVTEHNRKTEQPRIRERMQRAEILDGISAGLKTQGLIQDRIRGMTDSGARRESPSEVYGLLTPGPRRDDTASSEEKVNTRLGGHQFVMDDGPGQEKIRLRTRSGAQILLDESNGIVYINNRDGTAWIQMDQDGRIDVYSASTIAVRSERDIQFRADRDIVMEAGRNVSIKANRDWSPSESGSQHAGEGEGEGGDVLIQANSNLDAIVGDDYRITVNQDHYLSVGQDRNTVIGRDDNLQVEEFGNIIVNQGDWSLTVEGNVNTISGGNTDMFAGFDMRIQANNDFEQFAYQGKLDIGSNLNLSVKSRSGDISVEAEDPKGALTLKSIAGANQLVMQNPLSRFFSKGTLIMQSKKEVDIQTNEEFDVNSKGEITKGGQPLDGGCVKFDGGVNVSFTPTEIDMSAVEDVAIEVQNRVDKVGRRLQTSVNTINQNLETLEEATNQLSNWAGEYVTEIFNSINGFSFSSGFPSFSLPFPVIPSFPQLPSLTLPSLNLPNFPFDFCLDIGNLISIDQFNPFPSGLFNTVTIDLGGWSRSSIGGWYNRQRANLRSSIQSFNVIAQLRTNLDDNIRQVRGNINQISRSLKNLTSVSVVLTDNGNYYRDYSVGVRDLSRNLKSFVDSKPSLSEPELQSIRELQNQMEAQARSAEQIVKLIDQNPTAIDSSDFSELAEMSREFEEFSDQMDDIVVSMPGGTHG